MLYTTVPILNLLRVTSWVGGQAVMRVAVRTAAMQVPEPPQRQPFLATVLHLRRVPPVFGSALVSRVF